MKLGDEIRFRSTPLLGHSKGTHYYSGSIRDNLKKMDALNSDWFNVITRMRSFTNIGIEIGDEGEK